ncbi:MAG: ABC transporter ATP-binding protein/permease [Saccharofermentans sp.]|nr:ABC transporter ATP-binding protein/permease [Saccharofermentans sp.]
MGKRIGRVLSYMGRSKGMIFLSFILAAAYSALAMLIPYYAGKAIDLIDKDVADNIPHIFKSIILIASIVAGGALSQLIMLWINNRISYDLITNLKNAAYGKIRRLPISYIDRSEQGLIQSLVINDCETVGDGMILFLNQFFSGIVSIGVTLVIMLMLNWKIALYVLLFTPVSFIVAYLISSRSYKSFKSASEIRSSQTSYIGESCSRFREGKIYNIRNKTVESFDDINEAYRKTSSKATFLSSITNPSTRFVNALIYAGVALIGALSVISGNMTVGIMSSLLMYANQFMKPFNDLSSVFTELSDSFACLDRLFAFIDEKEIVPERENAPVAIADKDNIRIEFRDVTFSYVKGTPVLKNVSFVIEPGQSAAIVGPTGGGKSTVINLLLRYYDVDSGDILINGKSIYEIPRMELRRMIGLVAQDNWFKFGTVRENIKYGNPLLGDDAVREAAGKTGADSFIDNLPSRYEEEIGGDREDISEGQKQLLSITRIMAYDPSVIILDEATSSVDILTEVRIQKAVKELLAGRTGIIIAHRLSTIVDCDKIIVIDKGQISEIGSHSELIKSGGFYSRLYEAYGGLGVE